LNLIPQSTPGAPSEGDIWIDSGTDQLHIWLNGADRVVTVTPWP
jgi:hypothetical protein